MKIILLSVAIIVLITYPIALLCRRWDNSIKPIILVITAIGAILITYIINIVDHKIATPVVEIKVEKLEKEILINTKSSKPLKSLAIDLPVLGKIKNVHDNNSITNGRTSIKRIVGSNSPISQNNIEIYIEDMKPSVNLQYKIIYESLPMEITVASTDRYKLSYSWQHGGELNTISKWISLETGKEVDAPSVIVRGFEYHNRALTPEEIKKKYEEGLKKKELEQ